MRFAWNQEKAATNLDKHAVSFEEMESESRTARVVYARHHLMSLLRDEGWAHKQIGLLLGHRDHSTVVHGAQKHRERVALTGGGEE